MALRLTLTAVAVCLLQVSHGFTPTSTVLCPRTVASPLFSTRVQAASRAMPVPPNPFKKLPWNVQKEKQRLARKMKLEQATLHRELGIAEDATYEELVEATDALIMRAGSDIKRKIQIEVCKDKILQIRLNARLQGLAKASTDARAQSTFETEGNGEDFDEVRKIAAEWSAPRWTKGLVVKPDEKYRNEQIRLWGFITALGVALPPALDFLGRFTWVVCVAQLTFRGMPREQVSGGGMAMSFRGPGGGGHRKVSFALGIATWAFGAILVYGGMPAWAKGQRWTPSAAFIMQNLIFALSSLYLQPYKGGKSISNYDD